MFKFTLVLESFHTGYTWLQLWCYLRQCLGELLHVEPQICNLRLSWPSWIGLRASRRSNMRHFSDNNSETRLKCVCVCVYLPLPSNHSYYRLIAGWWRWPWGTQGVKGGHRQDASSAPKLRSCNYYLCVCVRVCVCAHVYEHASG